MANPKRTIPPHRPDDDTHEDHPRYSARYGYPRDERKAWMVLRGLAYRMSDDAWERALARDEKRKAVRKVGRIILQALDAGMPLDERKALYYRLMAEAGEPVCFVCSGPVHDGSCEDPDSGMWERDEPDTHERAEGEAA